MHIAGFDGRYAGNEPAFDALRAKLVREISGQRAEIYAFQICSRRRLMRLGRFRPHRPQTVDDLKQQRRCGSAADKRRVGTPIEVSNPNREHIMIEDCDRPGIAKTVRRSGLPINRRAVISVGAIHFRPRHIASISRVRNAASGERILFGFAIWSSLREAQRSQFAIVRERGVKSHQILH